MATLDEISEGRALLGLGVGGTSCRELGISTPLPVAALRESVDVIRRLLSGEEVSVEGKVVSLREGRLQFTPVRDRIPIYFATHGAQVARLAGEIADGVLLGNVLSPSGIDFYVEQIRMGAEKAGRTLHSLAISLRPEVCVCEDEAAAFAVMRRRCPPARLDPSTLGVSRASRGDRASHARRARCQEGGGARRSSHGSHPGFCRGGDCCRWSSGTCRPPARGGHPPRCQPDDRPSPRDSRHGDCAGAADIHGGCRAPHRKTDWAARMSCRSVSLGSWMSGAATRR
jgi:hypothetical protein